MGLDEQTIAVLRQCAEPEYRVKAYSPEAFIIEDAPEEDAPFAVFLSMGAWRRLQQRYGNAPCSEPPAWILIAENGPFGPELEDAISQGFAAILKIPLERRRVLNALSCAVESWYMHQDIMAMSKEIMLNRELLQRKSDNARFLVEFLAETTEPANAQSLLRTALHCLKALMPVAGISTLLRHTDNSGKKYAILFLPARKGVPAWDEWRKTLLEADRRLLSLPFLMEAANPALREGHEQDASSAPSFITTQSFSLLEPGEQSLLPATDKKRIFFMPIHAGMNAIGIICVQFEKDYNMGRERLAILHAALRHLGLVLRLLFLDRQETFADAVTDSGPETQAGA